MQSGLKTHRSELITKVMLSVVYSPLEKLSPAEIEAFKAEKFTIENLPIHPPPKEACCA